MRRFGITAAAGIFAALLAGQAYAAAPTCTGTTVILASGGTTNLAGLSGGNCAQVGDKIFGDASVGGAITGQPGNAQFTINVAANSTTVNFQGSVTGLASGNINYSVAVIGSTEVISAFQQDLTLSGNSASTTLVGGGDVTLTCTRTTLADGSAGPSDCPITQAVVPNLTSLSVTQTVTNNTATTNLTAITNTFFQTEIPEPGSLALLGAALVGFGAMWRRRRHAA